MIWDCSLSHVVRTCFYYSFCFSLRSELPEIVFTRIYIFFFGQELEFFVKVTFRYIFHVVKVVIRQCYLNHPARKQSLDPLTRLVLMLSSAEEEYLWTWVVVAVGTLE
jgi:hypothetical protein